jgi:hypothetical protein
LADAKLRFEKKPFIIKETPVSRLQRILGRGDHHAMYFRKIDINDDGKLSFDEWHKFCVDNDINLPRQDLQTIFGIMDQNNDQEVSLDEFQEDLLRLPPKLSGPDYSWLPLDNETALSFEVLPKDEDAAKFVKGSDLK